MVKCLQNCHQAARRPVEPGEAAGAAEGFGTVRIRLLGAPVDGLTPGQFVEKVSFYIDRKESCFLITLNPELLYRAQFEKDLLAMLNRAQLVTADGVGIVWACGVSGRPVPGRVTGIDLMMRLLECAAGRGWRVFFLGSAPGVAGQAAVKAAEMFPGLQVAGTHHGYFSGHESDGVLQGILDTSPDLLFVALGSPRQEIWIDRHLDRLKGIVAMGVGGSLDVLSGNVRRVPEWYSRHNLEWLGRLLSQPSRWRRMLALPKFALLVITKYGIGRISGR